MTTHCFSTAFGGLVVLALAGCRSTPVAVTNPSATQQFLLTQAYDVALEAVDYRPLEGKKAHLDAGNIKAANAGWLVYRLREVLCRHGVLLQNKPDEADLIIEAGVAVYGTDAESTFFGFTAPAIMATSGVVPSSSGPFSQTIDQYGAVRVALFAFDSRSRKRVWESGAIDAGSCTHAVYWPFLPARRTGTIVTPAQLMGPGCTKATGASTTCRAGEPPSQPPRPESKSASRNSALTSLPKDTE